MVDTGGRVTRVEMPDGTPVWARISGADALEEPSGELVFSDVGAGERVAARVEDLKDLVASVARSLAEPLRAVRPDEVSVEFSIELTAKPGKVVGLIADGEAKGGITVTLNWHGGPPDLTAPEPASAPVSAPVPPQPGAPAGAGPGATAHPGGGAAADGSAT
ncbi:CU044_2847 family protein [Streptomyces sp. NRRL F-5126]|uniref:CU044_2847 family protein n=1 Tax=Streptomyces sp. NRRL F-5126 TaxID=1463857 RepID=UPI0004CB023F